MLSHLKNYCYKEPERNGEYLSMIQVAIHYYHQATSYQSTFYLPFVGNILNNVE